MRPSLFLFRCHFRLALGFGRKNNGSSLIWWDSAWAGSGAGRRFPDISPLVKRARFERSWRVVSLAGDHVADQLGSRQDVSSCLWRLMLIRFYGFLQGNRLACLVSFGAVTLQGLLGIEQLDADCFFHSFWKKELFVVIFNGFVWFFLF